MNVIGSVPGNPPAGGAYSAAAQLQHGAVIYLAGHVGLTEAKERPAEFADEVVLAIDNLARTLAEAGGSLMDVVHTTCLLTDIGQFDVFDAAYRTRFAEPWPTRATYGVALAGGLRFEIVAVARQATGETTRLLPGDA